MKRALAALLVAGCGSVDTAAAQGDFAPLFNGKDLTGWVNVNCAPETWTVKDGAIVCSGVPTGVLRTERQYENYVLELEWKHLHEGGNAGLFLHSSSLPICGSPFTTAIEVQVMLADNPEGVWTRHGDVFAIKGATMKPDRPHPRGWMRCLPSENRVLGAGEWNHYRVESRDGRVTLSVNGKVVSGGSQCNPRKGYLCLESEGSEVHFRNIRIQELPSSNPPPDQVAEADPGFTAIYNGADLRGFRNVPGNEGHWNPGHEGWILDYDGKSEAEDKNLWTEKEYGDFTLIVDWRLLGSPKPAKFPEVLPNGENAKNPDGSVKMIEIQDYGDSGIFLRGNSKSQVNIWSWPIGSGEVYGYRTDPEMAPDVRAAVTPKVHADNPFGEWNRFVITMKGERLTVVLNGKTVIENAPLPGVPPKGAIALQHHGDPLQFANLYIKELK
jgi:hypothetical protein